MKSVDVVVVGAGHNGLVCATRLARRGHSVLVLERRHVVGGAVATEEIFPHHFFSSCAYVLHGLQRNVVRELNLRKHGFQNFVLDPLITHVVEPGVKVSEWQDPRRTLDELATLVPKADVEAFQAWSMLKKRAARILEPFVLSEAPTLADLRTQVSADDRALLDQFATESVTSLLESMFDSEIARAIVVNSLDGLDIDEPGVLLSLATTMTDALVDPSDQGLPVGGMGSLADALAASARESGVTIRLGADVDRILINEGQAVGVQLSDGQKIGARSVISNADPFTTFGQLVAGESPAAWERSTQEAPSARTASCKFHGSLSGLPTFAGFDAGSDPRTFAQVRLCRSMDQYRQAGQAAQRGEVPEQPIVVLQLPSVYDPTLAPKGRHTLSMWIRFVPVRPVAGTWDDLRDDTAARVVRNVSDFVPDLPELLDDWALYTPQDIETRVGMFNGNIHHTDHLPGQIFGDRLLGGNGHRSSIPGLYLCGAGTHPGGEVTGAPGYICADLVGDDLMT